MSAFELRTETGIPRRQNRKAIGKGKMGMKQKTNFVNQRSELEGRRNGNYLVREVEIAREKKREI